ncbi:hypothetical protein MNBD_PLANCTO03-788 [hydrothermal vent metagenome]|uniref:Uncharacterized protein n=1 Tax=hydrothermal vent metagenome TaxID=652676 RepID=A0A3B1E384_9ZZZZ
MNDIGMNPGDLIPIIAIGGGMLIAIVAITFGIIGRILETKAREATKRELAAYVAEGSMTPEDAEALIKSDMPSQKRRCQS